jgi:CheY-like chemotaxis protein
MKKIWIIDDDEEMIRAVSLMLKLLDCEVKYFLNARAGTKALIDGGRPDLLILDISMPEVTGIDVLEYVRRNNQWKDMPIIMLSSEATDVQVDEALAKGADAYAFKPVMIDELESAMQIAFQKHSK